MVAGWYDLFNGFGMVHAVMNHDVLCGLAGDGGERQSPNLDVAVVETSDGVFVGPVEMYLCDGGFLFD